MYALGALQGEERVSLEKHLEGCAGCRRELEQLRGDMALMALSTAGPVPPRRARQRLIEAVAREPRRSAAPARRRWWTLVPWVAAAALAVGLVALWLQNSDLQQRIAGLQDQSAQQLAELQRAREVVSTLTATDAMRVTLVAAKTPPQPQGKAIYVRDRSSLIFLASNLAAVAGAEGLRIVADSDQRRADSRWSVQAGCAWQCDRDQSAASAAGVQAKAFAITVEPESGSSAPTMPIVMVGAGE